MVEIKKKWIKIIAPKILNGFEVGETIHSGKLIGRTVEVNIGFLTNDIRKQHMKLKLIINEIKNDIANTEIKGYEIVKAHIRRAVRKDRIKVEESFTAECKDKIKIRIKPLIITRFKTNRSALTEIRKKIKEFCISYCTKMSYEDLIRNIIGNNLQKDLKNILKKIFPIALIEIKELKRI